MRGAQLLSAVAAETVTIDVTRGESRMTINLPRADVLDVAALVKAFVQP